MSSKLDPDYIVQPDAAPKELTSPFYLRNQEFCRDIERFILSKSGSIAGRYNAYSYIVSGTIRGNRTWKVLYRMSQDSGIRNGSSFSLEYRMIEWSTSLEHSKDDEFELHQFSLYEFFKSLLLFQLAFIKAGMSLSYLLRSKNRNSKFFEDTFSTLQNIVYRNELIYAKLKGKELKILIRSDKHHFEELERLMRSI